MARLKERNLDDVGPLIAGIRGHLDADRPTSEQVRRAVRSRLFGEAAPEQPSTRMVDQRYRLETLIGRGGMGAVYRAADTTSGQLVALKQLISPIADRQLRFRREFRTLAGLRHPRIVEVYAYGGGAAAPYYTMELLDGGDLMGQAPMPWKACCELLRDVASALAFLHARGLIHRDVTPRNVGLTGAGSAKLMDFGLLATVGLVGEVAGTPPFIAPESGRGLPLDHRVDLFGLGALGYWLLTGRHAFPARRVDDLTALWGQRPAAPAELASDIPPAVDDLICSLLSQDPLARPSSAVVVIDRLGAVAGLDGAPEIETARGYLESASLVGREAEMQCLQTLLDNTTSGSGGAVLIEATAGMGRTRLLREAGLRGQLAGAAVAYVEAEGGRGPYGLLRQVVKALTTCYATELQRTARPYLPFIGHILPELGGDDTAALAVSHLEGDPIEDRVRVHLALQSWLLDLSQLRPLLLLVDDIQSGDDASVAALAALAQSTRSRPVLIVASLRAEDSIRAHAAVTRLREASKSLRLGAMSPDDTNALVAGLFGETANVRALAVLMHDVGGGVPLHSFELAHHLVDTGVIRYADGMWLIPKSVARGTLPARLTEAMELRISCLSPESIEIAQALSVVKGAFSVALCIKLVSFPNAEQLFNALDELVLKEVFVGDGQTFRFRHAGLRRVLLQGLDEERRRALHQAVAEALGPDGQVPADREAEVGWHLYHAGQTERAAPLLERAGTKLFEVQSMSDAIAPLSTALEVYTRAGIRAPARLRIRRQLMLAGVLADRDTVLRNAEKGLDEAWHYAGMNLADRLARVVGRRVAVLLGALYAGARWILSPRERPSPVFALSCAVVCAVTAATCLSPMFAIEPLKRLLRRIDLLSAFRGTVLQGTYRLCEALLALAQGRLGAAQRATSQAHTTLVRDQRTPVTAFERRAGQSATRVPRALAAALLQDPQFEEDVRVIERMDLHGQAHTCLALRAFYHRFRGEEQRAREIERWAEEPQIALSATWIWRDATHWISSIAFAWTRDVIGLRRCIEQMEQLSRSGDELVDLIDLARGEYQRERGELNAARDLLTALLARVPPICFVRPYALAALAEVYVARGELVPAVALARRGMDLGDDPDSGSRIVRSRCLRTLALVYAIENNYARAQQLLAQALAEAEPLASPTVSGALHEAGASIARACGDRQAYERELELTRRWFAPTRNPALLARLERIAALGTRSTEPSSGAQSSDVAEALSLVVTTAYDADAAESAEPTDGAAAAAVDEFSNEHRLPITSSLLVQSAEPGAAKTGPVAPVPPR